MAKAFVRTTKEEVVVHHDVKTVHLELSIEEACVLLAVVAKIGGAPATTHRAETDRVYEALIEPLCNEITDPNPVSGRWSDLRRHYPIIDETVEQVNRGQSMVMRSEDE